MAVVPAILRAQWELAAAAAGVRLTCWTHERLSRGALPPRSPALVIVDEAHRFRNPATHRVRTLAPWLVGRRVLLLTATPIVNRLADLIALLRLVLPDDALALDGIGRLADLESCRTPPSALARVAIRSPRIALPAFVRAEHVITPDRDEIRRGRDAAAAVQHLRLSDVPATKRLLQSVLLDAAASSDAAFRAVLRRYRALLLQSRDAGGASRAMLRRFAGESLEQLVFWELLEPDGNGTELPLDDLPRLDAFLATAGDPDAWADSLIGSCDAMRPTVCFTRHRATARRLRMAAGDGAAWVTGSESGIGPHRVRRDAVLAAFGPARASWRTRRATPCMLVATDVAAEGLDLQAAGRIVHVDLPWTAMRIDQREGRLLRLGQSHADVETVVRLPPPDIERAVASGARLDRKRSLSEHWLGELVVSGQVYGQPARQPACAVICDDGIPADLVVVELACSGKTGTQFISRVRDGGAWRRDPVVVDELLHRARKHSRDAAPLQADRADWSVLGELNELCDAAARTVLAGHADRSACGDLTLATRVQRLARRAAAARDGTTLCRLDRLLRFAARAPTLGERMMLERLAMLPDTALLSTTLPEQPPPGPVAARAVAAILFRSGPGTLR